MRYTLQSLEIFWLVICIKKRYRVCAVLLEQVEFRLQFKVVFINQILIWCCEIVSIYNDNNSMFILDVWLWILDQLAVLLLAIWCVPYFDINWRLVFVEKLKLFHIRYTYGSVQLHGAFGHHIARSCLLARRAILHVSGTWSAVWVADHAWLWSFCIIVVHAKLLLSLNIFRYQSGLPSAKFANDGNSYQQPLVLVLFQIVTYILMILRERPNIRLSAHKCPNQIRFGRAVLWRYRIVIYITYFITIHNLKLSTLCSISSFILEPDIRSLEIIFSFYNYVFWVYAGAKVVLVCLLMWLLDIRGHGYQPIYILKMGVFYYHNGKKMILD